KMYGIDDAVLDSAIATARRLDVPVAGHTPSFYDSAEGVYKALRAGYASIEHLSGYSPALFASGKNDINGWPSDGTLDSAKLDALVSATARSGVWNCPTEVLFQLHLWPSDSMMAWPEM